MLRGARGFTSVASDGHLCLSLIERQVDDYMTSNGIEHEKEVPYPTDSSLNSTGLRADWRLRDGALVEAFGMPAVQAYADKMEIKRALAKKSGMKLIEVLPTDLLRLDQIFVRYLQK